MEGWNPSEGCTARCNSCRSGWVPFAWSSGIRPRRDPLIDAIGRTSDPCERPARHPPCCNPVPKFRLPQEKPICDINCYRREQYEAKMKEQCEELQKRVDQCYCYEPEMIIESLDPCRPLIVQTPPQIPPEQRFHLRDQKCKTNLIAGFFNPDDNKTNEEREREKCDPNWMTCGSNLKPYPCRGVIDYPIQRWVSEAEEARTCFRGGCEKSIYQKPEYIMKQRQLKLQRQMDQQYKMQMEMMEKEQREKYLYPSVGQCYTGACATGRCSDSPCCN